jgi:hypothetical protein
MKLEKIQERALRFIYEDYNSTYKELLHTKMYSKSTISTNKENAHYGIRMF